MTDRDRRPKSVRASSQRPHLAIVTDDRDLGEFLSEGLLVAGFWTSVMASGLQAIEVMRLRRFDLVIIDAGLCGLPASDVVARLRGRGSRDSGPISTVPIVVVDDSKSESISASPSADDVSAVFRPPLELDSLAVDLMQLVISWREQHPDEPWADASLPQARRSGDTSGR